MADSSLFFKKMLKIEPQYFLFGPTCETSFRDIQVWFLLFTQKFKNPF